MGSRSHSKHGAAGEAFAPGILVDRQIRRAMSEGLIGIEPFDERHLEPATYDLRVGQRAFLSTVASAVELSAVNPPLVLEPGTMALVQTLEALALCDRVCARIGPKTTLLRMGVLTLSGPQIDPGFKGGLIVNLLNLGARGVVLRYGAPFLSIEFHYLSEAPTGPTSTAFAGSVGVPPEQLFDLYASLRSVQSKAEDHRSPKRALRPGAIPDRCAAGPPKVFIIHGHDEACRHELKELLTARLRLDVVVMQDRPGQSRTFIEKFEQEAGSCNAAIAVLTPDDMVDATSGRYAQPRPNVMYELGWFAGKWGRARTLMILKQGTQVPSDLLGVEQIRFRERVAERVVELEREIATWTESE